MSAPARHRGRPRPWQRLRGRAESPATLKATALAAADLAPLDTTGLPVDTTNAVPVPQPERDTYQPAPVDEWTVPPTAPESGTPGTDAHRENRSPAAAEPVPAAPGALVAPPAAAPPAVVEPAVVEPVAVEPVAVEPVAVEPPVVEPAAVRQAEAPEPAAQAPVVARPEAPAPVVRAPMRAVPAPPAHAPATAPLGLSAAIAARGGEAPVSTFAAPAPPKPSTTPGRIGPGAAWAARAAGQPATPPAPAAGGVAQLTTLQKAGDLGVTALSLVRRLALALAIGMLAWSLIPVAFGWQTSVVISASMAPAIRVGDVVATAPVAAADVAKLPKGSVILMDDPAKPGKLLLHRLVRHRKDGTVITKGDANKANDSTPVEADKVRGVARLRVPIVGLPVLWIQHKQWPPLAALGVLVSIIVLWQPRRPTPR